MVRYGAAWERMCDAYLDWVVKNEKGKAETGTYTDIDRKYEPINPWAVTYRDPVIQAAYEWFLFDYQSSRPHVLLGDVSADKDAEWRHRMDSRRARVRSWWRSFFWLMAPTLVILAIATVFVLSLVLARILQ